jgi:hypothetical protein
VRVCLHGNKKGGGVPVRTFFSKNETQVYAFWYFQEWAHRMIKYWISVSRADPFNVLCSAGNFSKITPTFGEH